MYCGGVLAGSSEVHSGDSRLENNRSNRHHGCRISCRSVLPHQTFIADGISYLLQYRHTVLSVRPTYMSTYCVQWSYVHVV